ncbi:MAG: hypothetical protein AABY22_04895 [Nanoarchaeota archaeon]
MQQIKNKEEIHIHEYERSRYSKEIYRCVHPQCHHYTKRGYLVGKEALCSKCKNTFILTSHQLIKMNVKIPVCEYCSKSPKAAQLRAAREAAFKAMVEVLGDAEKTIEISEENKDNFQNLLDQTLE